MRQRGVSLSVFLASLTLLCLLSILLHPVSASAGIRGPSESQRTFDYVPGRTVDIPFYIHGSDYLKLLVQAGQFADDLEITDPDPGGGPRSIDVKLTIPEGLQPGLHKIYIGAIEAPPGGMLGGRAAVLMSIRIKVLSDTPNLKAELDVDPAGEDSAMTQGHLIVESWSKQALTFSGYIALADSENNTISTIPIPTTPIASNDKVTYPFNLPTAGLRRGFYPVTAHVRYGENATIAKATLRIGTKNLKLTRYTDRVTQGKINRFDFELESDWNEELADVAGQAVLGDYRSQRTAGQAINPFGQTQYTAYIDATDFGLGVLNGSLEVSFDGGQKSFPITVNVVAEQTEAANLTPQEAQEARGFFIPLDSLTLLYLALVVLILINIFFLFFRREGGRKRDKDGDLLPPGVKR